MSIQKIERTCQVCGALFYVYPSKVKAAACRYCSHACYGASKKGINFGKNLNVNGAPIEERFWAKVDKSGGPDACWPWTGTQTAKGYGQAFFDKARRAHRMAYEFTHGAIPAEFMVCHACDNRLCCNPAHLFLGDAKDNFWDGVNKGRISQKPPWLTK